MIRTVLAGAALAGLFVGMAGAESIDDIRLKARSVCMFDAMTLCTSAIPDESLIVACMKARRTQLSTPCRQVFDAGVRLSRHRQQSMR